MVATSCDLYAPRCATTVPQVRFTGPREVSSLVTDSLGDPGDPLLYWKERRKKKKKGEVLHLFRCYTHTLVIDLMRNLRMMCFWSPWGVLRIRSLRQRSLKWWNQSCTCICLKPSVDLNSLRQFNTSRYVTPASQSHIIHECSPLRWAISCRHEIAPLLSVHQKNRML